jgi:hypothetical protein
MTSPTSTPTTTTTDADVQGRMADRDAAAAAGWGDDRVDTELPVLFTDAEWDVMMNDPAFGYVCSRGHHLTGADHRYGACFSCEADYECDREADYADGDGEG